MIGTTMLFLLLLQGAKASPAQPGVSTKAGVEAEAKAFFSMLDTNKDGKVERSEAQDFHAKAVSQSERTRRGASETFAELDDNKDGMLSRQEYMAIAGSAPPPREVWFDGNDQNKDGKVELREALGRVIVTFDALDANKDGKLSAQEKAAARGGATARP